MNDAYKVYEPSTPEPAFESKAKHTDPLFKTLGKVVPNGALTSNKLLGSSQSKYLPNIVVGDGTGAGTGVGTGTGTGVGVPQVRFPAEQPPEVIAVILTLHTPVTPLV